MSIKYNEHLKKALLNKDRIINSFLSRRDIQGNRQALGTLITIDKIVLKSKKDHERVYLYNSESKELEENNLKDLIDSYIFPAVSNKQDVKAIGGYFKEVHFQHIRLYNKVIRNEPISLNNEEVNRAFKTISNAINDLKYKQDTLIGAYRVSGFNLKKGNDKGIKEVV